MKKQIVVALIFVSTFLTGCWNRRELSNMALIFEHGYDISKEGEYIATAQVFNPSNRYYVVSSKGLSGFEAVRDASRQSGRRLYSGQNQVLILGEKLSRSGIFPIADYWYRDIEGQPRANVLITKGKASDIVSMIQPSQDIPGLSIEELINVSYATSKVGVMTLYELMKTINSKTSGSYAPGIEISENINSQSLRLNGTAVFKKDKLAGWFDDDQSRGLLWIIGKVKGGDIEILSPNSTEKQPKFVPLKILTDSTKVEPIIEDGKLSINLKIKTDCIVAAQPDPELRLDKVDTLKELQKRAEEGIRKDINDALNKGQQELNVDVFKFDQEFHRKFPKQWKELEDNWDEEFPKIQVKKEIEVNIRRTGLQLSYDED